MNQLAELIVRANVRYWFVHAVIPFISLIVATGLALKDENLYWIPLLFAGQLVLLASLRALIGYLEHKIDKLNKELTFKEVTNE